jgi:cholesterol transport system auxiliary component
MKRMLRPWLCLPVILLAGCSMLATGDKAPTTTYAPDVRIAPDPGWPQVNWQLAIVKPSAAGLVDSPRIGVRPTPAVLEVYRGASWAQPTTDLVEDTLLRAFEDSGKIAAVARVGSGIRADYKLVLDLRRFESDYAGQSLPSATIELSAKLLHTGSQRVAASRTFLITRPASATDVASVAAAFEQALAQLGSEVVGWSLLSGQRDTSTHH